MKIFRATLAGLLLLLAGMVALLLLIRADANLFRHPLMALATWQLGRPVVVDGDLVIRPGKVLYLRAEGLRLPDVHDADGQDTLTIGRIDVDIDTASLFSRPLILRRVEIAGATLLVDQVADAARSAESGDGNFEWPESLPVVIREMLISDSRARVTVPRLARPVDLRLARLKQTHVASGILRIEGEGLVNEIPLRIEGSAGPFESLLLARDFSVAARVSAGDLVMALETKIDSLAKPSGSTIRARLRAPDTGYLSTWLGVQNLGEGSVELDAEVIPDADGPGQQGSINGQIGQFTVDARGRLDDPVETSKASLDIKLSGPDLEFAGALAGIGDLPSEPFRLTSTLEYENDRLSIERARLSVADSDFSMQGTVGKWSARQDINVTFAFQGPDVARIRAWLGLPGQLDGRYSVSGRFSADEDGEQSVDLTAETSLAKLQVAGTLGGFPELYGTRVRVGASGDNLAKLGKLGGVSGLPAGSFTVDGDVEWTARGIILRGTEVRTGMDRLTLDGRMGSDPLGSDTDVRISISGENLARSASSLGFGAIAGLPSAPYSLKGRLRRKKAASQLDDLRGTLAGARVVASGRIGDTPALGSELKFSVEGARFEEFSGFVPGYKLPEGAFSAAGNLALDKEGLVIRGLSLSAAGAEVTADARLALPLGTATGQFDMQARGPDLARLLPRAKGSALSRGPFDLAVRGTAASGRWTFEKARIDTGLGRASGTGTLDWAPGFSATSLQLEVQLKNLADVGQLADIKLPPEPFGIVAEVSGTPTSLVTRNARGRLGEVDFSGQFTVDLAGRPAVDLQLKTSMLDLRPFTDGSSGPRKASAARGAARTARLIPNLKLNLDWLRKFDASVSLQSDRARVGNLVLGNTSLRSTLRNGDLVVEALDARGGGDGQLTLSGALTQRAGIANLEISARGTGIALGLPSESAGQYQARPRADIELDLAGQGATLRELAATLDGRLHLMSGPGEIPVVDTGRYFGSLWRQLVGVVSPGFQAPPTTKVACFGAFVTAKDGLLTSVPALVLQTDRSNVIARGIVNLATEEIDVLLRITPRRRLDINIAEIINPNIRLAGTLASPLPRVDSKTTILGGGAAVATGGLSIVALSVWDRTFKSREPCAEIEKEAKGLESGESPKRRSLIPKVLRRR